MTDNEHIKVKRRAVFFIGGFDPKSADQFFARMSRENERFKEVWETAVEAGPLQSLQDDTTLVQYHTKANGPSPTWTVVTDFNFLTLDDVVLTEFNRPLPARFWRYGVTFWNYFLSGTAFSFIRHAWRFFLYFAYPAAMIAFAFAISLLLAFAISNSGVPFHNLAGVIAFIASFCGLVKFGGNRYHVLHLMDLWSFSRDYLFQENETIKSKLSRFSNHIVTADQSGDFDEILLIGHSTGGALILDAAGQAAEKDAQFGSRNADTVVLTVGSTALKVGLHPAASWFRKRTRNLFKNHAVGWVEYQCMSDIINFYSTKPAELMGFADDIQRPFLKRRIKLKEMVKPDVYKRLRENFFRIHYQFVYGNNYKYHYDFPAICFGPAYVTERIKNPLPFMTQLDGSTSTPVRLENS